MKTLFNSALKTLLVSAALLISSLAMAQKASQEAPHYEKKAFDITIFPAATPSVMWVVVDKKNLNRVVVVELLDAKGQVIASERYPKKQPAINTRFNLSQIGDGLYTFRISDGQQTRERTFKLATPGFEEQLPKRLITMN